jgi:hypothetical protein
MCVDPRRERSIIEPLRPIEEKVFALVRGAVDEGLLAAQLRKQVLIDSIPGVEHNRVEVSYRATIWVRGRRQ